ncbi:TetR/AcrR family transcriptional regulator [Dactylosporangium sp. NPDC048998]|uniref:TetR/AcrR family transcriptional regulator n=1 Tax=Dactylosporangium sp. NPDC048998 TaxID=3363976 RepID=UPI003718178C
MSESVRSAMVEAAWLLIAERGLEGMSTREVLARTGAPRGSVYHYFPRGRTELIEHAIDHSRGWMQDQIGALRAETPDDVVTGYIDIWRRVVEGTGFRAGCAATGVVIGGYDPDLLDRAAAAFQAAIDALADRFQQLGLTANQAARRATMLVTAAEGAVVLARAHRSVEPLALVAEQLSENGT